MLPSHLTEKAAELLELCKPKGLMIATAESCTGGLIAGCLTEIAGSSAVVDRGFVTYTNEAKADLLGVASAMIEQHGAVSEPVAISMAEGALRRSQADLAVAVTGVAGPGGGSEEKPVGLVHFGLARTGQATQHLRCVFEGDRSAVRADTVSQALDLLRQSVESD